MSQVERLCLELTLRMVLSNERGKSSTVCNMFEVFAPDSPPLCSRTSFLLHFVNLSPVYLHRVSKNVQRCHNFDTHERILIFFGRDATDKVGNQMTLYYATANNFCFRDIWQNGETRKSHFFSLKCCISWEHCSDWAVLHNALVRCLPERKKCQLWCVWWRLTFVEIVRNSINIVHWLSLQTWRRTAPIFYTATDTLTDLVNISMLVTDSRMLCSFPRSCLLHPVYRFDSEEWFSCNQVTF